MRGSLLRLPDGLTVVPTHPTAGGAWSCVVLYDPRGTYPPEGFSVELTADVLGRAVHVEVPGHSSEPPRVQVETEETTTFAPLDEARLRAARDAGASAALREAAGYAEELGSPSSGLVSREVVARWLESFADRLDNGLEMHP